MSHSNFYTSQGLQNRNTSGPKSSQLTQKGQKNGQKSTFHHKSSESDESDENDEKSIPTGHQFIEFSTEDEEEDDYKGSDGDNDENIDDNDDNDDNDNNGSNDIDGVDDDVHTPKPTKFVSNNVQKQQNQEKNQQNLKKNRFAAAISRDDDNDDDDDFIELVTPAAASGSGDATTNSAAVGGSGQQRSQINGTTGTTRGSRNNPSNMANMSPEDQLQQLFGQFMGGGQGASLFRGMNSGQQQQQHSFSQRNNDDINQLFTQQQQQYQHSGGQMGLMGNMDQSENLHPSSNPQERSRLEKDNKLIFLPLLILALIFLHLPNFFLFGKFQNFIHLHFLTSPYLTIIITSIIIQFIYQTILSFVFPSYNQGLDPNLRFLLMSHPIGANILKFGTPILKIFQFFQSTVSTSCRLLAACLVISLILTVGEGIIW